MKILKWSGIAIAVLLTILIAVISIFYFITIQHENQTYEIDVPPLNVQFDDEEEVYLTGRHGANFGGGKIPGVPPHWPEASNITIGGALADYQTDVDFFRALREGITPDGRQMDPEFMPWSVFGYMTDAELSGLLEYLKSLPPIETGTR